MAKLLDAIDNVFNGTIATESLLMSQSQLIASVLSDSSNVPTERTGSTLNSLSSLLNKVQTKPDRNSSIPMAKLTTTVADGIAGLCMVEWS